MPTVEEYEKFCRSTAVYPMIGSNWQYTLIGLMGELGELSNQLKKVLRDDKGRITPERRAKLIDELGDIYWYLFRLTSEMCFSPNFIMEENITKLSKRLDSNSIHDNENRKS